MIRRSTAYVLIFLAMGLACSENEAPLPANCEVNVSEIDFGSRLPPLDDEFDDTVERNLVVKNQPLRISTAGNEDLVGSLSFDFDTQAADPPRIHLVPEELDPEFRFSPGDVVYVCGSDEATRRFVETFPQP